MNKVIKCLFNIITVCCAHICIRSRIRTKWSCSARHTFSNNFHRSFVSRTRVVVFYYCSIDHEKDGVVVKFVGTVAALSNFSSKVAVNAALPRSWTCVPQRVAVSGTLQTPQQFPRNHTTHIIVKKQTRQNQHRNTSKHTHQQQQHREKTQRNAIIPQEKYDAQSSTPAQSPAQDHYDDTAEGSSTFTVDTTVTDGWGRSLLHPIGGYHQEQELPCLLPEIFGIFALYRYVCFL